MKDPRGKAIVAPYTVDGTRYLVIVTESGRKPTDPKTQFSINFTVEPFKASQKAPENVVVHTASGRHAYVRLALDNDPDHKFWAQFVIHKPGRKIRVFGSEKVDGTSDWNEIPSVTRRIVMTDERPWFRDVTLIDWISTPTIDKA
jgi:hypothetical protein